MTTKQLLVKAVLFFTVLGAYSQSFKTETFGKGLRFESADSSLTVKMHFRMQSLMVGQYDMQSEEFNSDFLIRRSRLKFSGMAFSPRLKYKAEVGLSNRDIGIGREDGNTGGGSRMILDAVLQYKIQKNWEVWMGQTKLPGNRERVVSSADLQFVDRSLVNSRFNIDRDMGVQLRGKYKFGEAFVIQPKFAFSQGEGRNITAGNYGGYCYTARLDVLPLGEFEGKKQDYVLADITRQSTPKVAIGITANLNQGAVRQQGQLGRFVYDTTGQYAENDLQHLQADVHFKWQGFSFLSEAAYTGSSQQMDWVSSLYNTGWGFNAQAGYVFPSNVEIAGRYTKIAPDDDRYSGITDTDEYTLALSRYIVNHSLKVQSDVSWIVQDQRDERVRVRFQVEMQF